MNTVTKKQIESNPWKKTDDIKTLVINTTDEDTTFTEQLEKIISDINEGYTSGLNWSIGELEKE